MTSSNGNIFRVTGHLCGEFTGPGEFPAQRPVTRSLGVFFDLRQNLRLSKQSRGWWFETLSRPLWLYGIDESITTSLPFPNLALWKASAERYMNAWHEHIDTLWCSTKLVIKRKCIKVYFAKPSMEFYINCLIQFSGAIMIKFLCDYLIRALFTSGRNSYRQISWSLEGVRSYVIIMASLCNFTGISVTLLPTCLSTVRSIGENSQPESHAS